MALPTETAEDAEMKAIRKPGKQETGKRGAGELATQYLQVGRPLLWAPLVWRAEDCPPYQYFSALFRMLCRELQRPTCTQSRRWMGRQDG
jgi:hypothetical protein